MLRLAALVVALLPLAGCLGAETPDETTTPAACPPEADCLAPTPQSEAAELPPPQAPREVSAPFSYEGSTGSAVCPPVARVRAFGHCVSLQPARGEAPELRVPIPRRLTATLTAEAAPVAAPFYVSLLVDAGEGWTWDPEREPGARGEAPLAVDWDLSAYPEGAAFMFYVESGRAVGPLSFGLDRAYAVEGVLTGVAPAS